MEVEMIHGKDQRKFLIALNTMGKIGWRPKWETFRVNLGGQGAWFTILLVKDEGIVSK